MTLQSENFGESKDFEKWLSLQMLSAQIDSWGKEVENNRKSWQPGGSSSSSSWSWLRAVPLLLIAVAMAAIFSVDVDLLRGTFFFSHPL